MKIANTAALFLIFGIASMTVVQATPITDVWTPLKPGIQLLTRTLQKPDRRMHAVQINLKDANVTIRASNDNEAALTPKKFASQVGAYIAINGDFFDAAHGYQPLGPAVGDGVYWPKTPYFKNWFNFSCISSSDCEIKKFPGEINKNWLNVVGGRDQILKNGVAWTAADDKKCGVLCTGQDPRTVIGLSADRNILTLLVVEGRQEEAGGISVSQAAKVLAELGASDGLHLDGGGSSQLVIDGKLISKRPDTEPDERPVGNCLGIILN